MSQVLNGGAGNVPQKVPGLGKPVVGQGASNHGNLTASGTTQPQPSSSLNHRASPTAGMPGVLPGSILTGHMQKVSAIPKHPLNVAGGAIKPTPIIGSRASMNGAASQQKTAVQVTLASPDNQEQASPTATASGPDNVLENSSLANTKEKTPMCLINELARFNKIQHQYTLTDEQGPAHKKVFYVKLTLGEEDYAADGASIKKGQHAAAAIALEHTQYKTPPPKPPRANAVGIELMPGNPSITPTVELNAMAMKLGQPAIYRPLEPARNNFYPANMNFRGMYNQRYHQQPRYPRTFYVSLKVGQREFIGEGNTRQCARHNAAEKALKVLSVLPITSDETLDVEDTNNEVEEDNEDLDDPLKSEISLVHEIALKRNLPVNFEVIKEAGPPHMKTFVTRCTCGAFHADGEGNSKKLSKKRAAEKMLEQLQKMPPIPNAPVTKPKKAPAKKKNNRNLIKKADPDYGVGINPISRLIQIQQAKKEKEPIYVLLAEKGMPRRKEFVMQVTVGEQNCTGVGPNKKLAKRNAAEVMLQMLGYSRPAPQPSKPAIKCGDTASPSGDKKVTFLETEAHPPTRQLVPGVLMIPESPRAKMKAEQQQQALYMTAGGVSRVPGAPSYTPNMSDPMSVTFSPQTTAAIAKELLDTGASPTAEAINKLGSKQTVGQSVIRPKQQLLYLAEVLGFQVQFTDFPKSGRKSEYLSLASLSTNPPQVSHGSDLTIEASHDMAALNALKALSDAGLDSVSPADVASGDGHQLKPAIKTEKAN